MKLLNLYFSPDGGAGDGGGGSASAPDGGGGTPAPGGGTPAPVIAPVGAPPPGGEVPQQQEPTPDGATGGSGGETATPPDGWPEGVPFEAAPSPVLELEDGGTQVVEGGLPEEVLNHPAYQQQVRQMQYLQQQYDGMLQELDQARQALTEYETAGLDEEEIARQQLQRDREQIAEQQSQLQEAMYRSELYGFYTQFVPKTVLQGNDPSVWHETTIRYLHKSVSDLYRENLALRRAIRPGANAPNVGNAGGGGASPVRRIGQLSDDEMEAILNKAKAGQLQPGDIPGTG